MTDVDEPLVEVEIFVLLPCWDMVLLEELEPLVPAHLLTCIDQRLTVRKGEGEHSHELCCIAHSLELCSCP